MSRRAREARSGRPAPPAGPRLGVAPEGRARRWDVDPGRKRAAMVPFFLIFGLTWLGFGIFALVEGASRSDGTGMLAGGTIGLLGALLLGRGFMLRRQVRGGG